MKLLEVLSRNEEGKVYRAKGGNCIYKVEKGNLYVRNIYLKTWYESEMKVDDLMKIEVEELIGDETTRNMFIGETSYFIDDEGEVLEDEEDFLETDANRYKIGNYFKSEEEAEVCRDLIKKTIRALKGKNIGKQECEEELEKEFKEIKMIKLNKNPIEKLTIGSNFGLLSDFKKAKECIYLDINGECIGLSFSEWDLLNQYIEKLRKFK